MRIRLLAAIGGHNVGDVLDHDHQAAEWLISGGFAVASDDAHDSTEPAKVPSAPQQQPAATRRTGKRPPR